MTEVRKGLLLAIDPGDVHVGVAWFDQQAGPSGELAWGCVYVEEMTPDEFHQYIWPAMASGIFDYVVVESFNLYGDKALEQTGSSMETSQMIGWIKAVHWILWTQWGLQIKLVMQPPSIKKAVFAILGRKGYKFTADRLNVPAQHVRDAEVHGVKFIKQQDWRMLKTSELWTEARP